MTRAPLEFEHFSSCGLPSLSKSMASLHNLRQPVVKTRMMILYSENTDSFPSLTVTNVHEDQNACTVMRTNCMETPQ